MRPRGYRRHGLLRILHPDVPRHLRHVADLMELPYLHRDLVTELEALDTAAIRRRLQEQRRGLTTKRRQLHADVLPLTLQPQYPRPHRSDHVPIRAHFLSSLSGPTPGITTTALSRRRAPGADDPSRVVLHEHGALTDHQPFQLCLAGS